MKNTGTINLETERLILRKINVNDYREAYTSWCNDERVSRYVFWYPHKNENITKELYDMWIKEYDKDYTYRWIVQNKDTNELMGTIDVVKANIDDKIAEVGYCYGVKFWGQGYGTEALKEVLKYLFQEGFDIITLKHDANNPASGRIMQKCGMKQDGIFRKRVIDKYSKQRNDIIEYSITKEEYIEKWEKI